MMGSFEKLVVLTVLFLVVLVLGVTLNSGEPEDAGSALADAPFSGPLESARHRARADEGGQPSGFLPDQSGRGSGGGARDAAEGGQRSSAPDLGLLSSNVEPGQRGLIVNEAGLEEHPMIPDFRIYEVRENETWTLLAERFYGDRARAALLRQANDAPGAPVPGESILVPVYDPTAGADERPRREPWRTAAPQQPGPLAADRYEVVPGDSLSVISLKVYGTSRRWDEIYAANQERLADPDTLDVGMVLRIP